ncbi:MAG: GtrA family protein [Cyanobacteria bacterium]|nr:GtrA family protein [Cyanobacteria bacterium CG_2015-16_32_12]NCO77068.1 GtrA family protein [Cyanobacteria bacterium CG_2015-22_32_23]NCQ03640.1 GtrA family protein [Cyanobacteria bacterium CG_2015-09_32_10]NCQ40367.1 GtrA family protein [Cyanobacteria bacterium CG_2015-04_32_10]NCS84635.1 GtrA family protein [Cyanobacteria bacterium CG_2015-02_32_10]
MKINPYFQTLKETIEQKKEIIKFTLVGGLCLTFNLGILWILTDKFFLEEMLATIIGFFLSNLLGFFLNKYFTFKVRNTNIWKEIYKYYAVMTSSFIANLIAMFILVKLLNIWIVYASLMIAIIFYVYNYFMHKNWSFK